MDRRTRLLLAVALLSLAACGDAERGGYCFTGACQVADGGTYAYQACDRYWCYLPEEAPSAGRAACARYPQPDAGCVTKPVCTATYASRDDWEDCYRKYKY